MFAMVWSNFLLWPPELGHDITAICTLKYCMLYINKNIFLYNRWVEVLIVLHNYDIM